MTDQIKAPFYASGSRGKSVRGDGNSGTMARGWYYRDSDGKFHGPFKSEAQARRDAYGWNAA